MTNKQKVSGTRVTVDNSEQNENGHLYRNFERVEKRFAFEN
jgi:hypothetical protein